MTKADAVDDGDARARARRGSRARARGGGRSPSAPRPGWVSTSCGPRSRASPTARRSCDALPGRRGSTSTGSSRCAASAPSSPARSGRGRSREGDVLEVEPGGGEVRVRSRAGARRCRSSAAAAGERVALGLPGVERRELHRGDALVDAGRVPGLVPARRRARGARADRRRRAGLRASWHVPHSRARRARSGRRRRSCGSRRPSSRRAAIASCSAARRRSAAATVLDPAPPRRLDQARLELLERGDPGVDRVGDRARARVGRVASSARACSLRPSSRRGWRRCVACGGWAFSEMWLEETRESVVDRLRARAEAVAARTGARASPSSCRPSPGRRRCCRCCPIERRGGMAYLPARRRRSVRARQRPRTLERELEACRPRQR